jgi:hypothetical protein
MALPPDLPPPPPHPEPNVLRANEIITEGYHAARNILAITKPDLQCVRHHREHILSEVIPLLDIVSGSTSDAATHAWCGTVTIAVADLFNQLAESEAEAQHMFEISRLY